MGPFDDLAPLLVPRPERGVGYRQGIIRSWNTLTAENTVEVDGTTLTDLPILNTTEALQLAPGDVVGILTHNHSWCILGRLTTPGTPAAASALSAVSSGIRAATTITQEPTSSTTYTDLATIGPTVTATIRGSGKALVIASCQIGSSYTGVDTVGGAVSFTASGANTLDTTTDHELRDYTSTGGATGQAFVRQYGGTFYLDGLAPGATTFTLKYKSIVAGLNADFSDRTLIVWPL